MVLLRSSSHGWCPLGSELRQGDPCFGSDGCHRYSTGRSNDNLDPNDAVADSNGDSDACSHVNAGTHLDVNAHSYGYAAPYGRSFGSIGRGVS